MFSLKAPAMPSSSLVPESGATVIESCCAPDGARGLISTLNVPFAMLVMATPHANRETA
jgi:hypothetical protein